MKPPVREIRTAFSEAAFKPGGVLVTSALQRAEAALEARAEASIAIINDAIEAIEALSREPGSEVETLADAVTGHALDIIDAAFACPGTDVEAGARLTAELAALGARAGALDTASLGVAAASLRLLFHQGRAMTQAERRKVLDGVLRVIRKRIGEPGASLRPRRSPPAGAQALRGT